ncbi:MAG: hypothetical protein WC979_02485 [Candidatus Pacearchaeota archaeon]|jgi:hypothetical protein|nr:hypothetical protein [Clostridia bacterium]
MTIIENPKIRQSYLKDFELFRETGAFNYAKAIGLHVTLIPANKWKNISTTIEMEDTTIKTKSVKWVFTEKKR